MGFKMAEMKDKIFAVDEAAVHVVLLLYPFCSLKGGKMKSVYIEKFQ